MSVRLYVGNLPEELSRQELEAVFADAGDTISTKLITDRKTNKCRGFGFVTVKTDEQADELIEKFNGFVLKDNALKIEKALPRAKGKDDEAAAEIEPSAPSVNSSSRRKSNKGRRGQLTTTAPNNDTDSFQPDPRWAQELEKLKQMLAAQTTNS
ncbi:MAG: RNA recognition motif domain-containing protein [Leptolyngbyaceae cyanobacterium]